MNTHHRMSRVRSACAATFLAILALSWIAPPAAWAQLLSRLVVTLSSPSSGSAVRGTIPVDASVTVIGALTVAGVQFQLDGVNLGAEDTTKPYSISWNTATASNGSHSLQAVARDLLGVRWTSDSVTITVDNLPPGVTLNQAAGQPDPTNASPINFTVVFTEPVTGFTAADVTISGTAAGTKTVAVTGGPSTYNLAVSGMINGTVTAAIAAGMAHDAAGNGNTASIGTDNTVAFDATPPTVTINQAAGQPDPANSSPLQFTVQFSEPIVDFTSGDVTIGGTAGGAKTVAVTGGPGTFNVAVSGMTDGSVIATVGAGTVRDGAGNLNLASGSTDNQVAFDATPPAPASTPDLAAESDSGASNADNRTKDNTPTFTGTAESGSTVKIFSDGAQVASGVAAEGTYTITTSPLSDGAHSITATATDAANNTSPASAALTVTIDTASPSIAVTAPAGGAMVAGTVSLTASASDAIGVDGVQFQLNGVNLGAELTAAPYSMTWNTTTVADGSHTLTAVARDAAGNASTSAPIMVTVANTTATARVEDTSTDITYAPADTWMLGYSGGFAWSGGTAALGFVAGQRATFSFNGTGISWIGFRGPTAGIANVYLDGAPAGTVDTYAPESTTQVMLFSASGLASGPHTLAIEVTRTKNDASSDYYVVVDAFDVAGASTTPDTTPPAVTITAPITGATVSGTTSVAANASDNVGIANVRFFVDGVEIGEDNAAPYAVAWNTTLRANGSSTLTAVARDQAGNTTSSAAVSVTVSNTGSTPSETATRFEETDPSIIYTDGTPAAGRPDRWWYGSRSREWSGKISAFNRSNGARATFRFTGTSVSWIGFRSHWAGIARVYLDGAFLTEIDLFEPPNPSDPKNGEKAQAVVFSLTGLASGSHTFAVESTGRKHGGDVCDAVADPANCASDYAVVVDAFDVAPPVAPPPAGERSEDTSLIFTAGSDGTAWSQADAGYSWSGGTAVVNGSAGARATFAFTGTSVRWIGVRGPQNGIARVSIDGTFHGQVDTHAPTAIQAVVFTATGLAPARHTLTIEATGSRNTAATDSRIVVDAVDTQSRFEDVSPSIIYTGTGWRKENADKAWSGASANAGSGTAALSATAGDDAAFTFAGTSVTLIGFRGPLAGIANVYVDGVLVSQVDLYSPTEAVEVPVFTASALPDGTHSVRVVVTGDKHPSASGAFVVIDAFDVSLSPSQPAVTRVQESDSSITYTPSTEWTSGSRFTFDSGEFSMASYRVDPGTGQAVVTAGTKMTLAFSGTSVRWIGRRGFSTGVAHVALDGVRVATIDTHAPLQEEHQAAIYSVTGLIPGSHTLEIELTGRNNEAPGTPVQHPVWVDAFDVY